MKQPDPVTSFRIPTSQLDQVRKQAKADGVSASELVRKALDAYLSTRSTPTNGNGTQRAVSAIPSK
ncbi:MAG: ribbon-helix-helix protein, CopG family [Caldilineales bacterium]|nr:ribbon-helix-helix protein, CopG family [Caldilineales bacterium]